MIMMVLYSIGMMRTTIFHMFPLDNNRYLVIDLFVPLILHLQHVTNDTVL